MQEGIKLYAKTESEITSNVDVYKLLEAKVKVAPHSIPSSKCENTITDSAM